MSRTALDGSRVSLAPAKTADALARAVSRDDSRPRLLGRLSIDTVGPEQRPGVDDVAGARDDRQDGGDRQQPAGRGVCPGPEPVRTDARKLSAGSSVGGQQNTA